MPVTRTALFLEVKKTLRAHPDWTDDQIALMAGLKGPVELDLITTARRDLAADGPEAGYGQ